jgi:hypothetical protein
MNHDRKELSSRTLVDGHRNQTIRRMANEKTALIIQDTMEMNFSTRLHCDALGSIGKNQTGAESQGLKMHSSIAANTRGMPLGVLRAQIYSAKPKPRVKLKVDKRPIEEKESYRWLQTSEDAY